MRTEMAQRDNTGRGREKEDGAMEERTEGEKSVVGNANNATQRERD